MNFQNQTKARRILGLWRGESETHIQSDLRRASNEAAGTKDKRIGLIFEGELEFI